MNVVSLCDLTGNMVKPWAEAGHQCYCYDWQHSIRKDRNDGNITYLWADVRGLTLEDLPNNVAIAFAFPDCTNLALSGARDFAKKGIQGLIDALTLVEACRRLLENLSCPWMLENPMSRLSSCWRKPDHKFSPWMYGDAYQKETWLWTGGGFQMPEPSVSTKPSNVAELIHLMPPSHDRAAKRSITPMGFAEAVFNANHARLAKAA